MPMPAPNPTDAVRDHVVTLHDLASGIDGVLVVSTFHANPGGYKDAPGAVTHHKIGDVDGMTAAILAHADTPNANVFCGLQVMRRDLPRGARGGEADIVAVLGLVADMDGDTGKIGDLPLEPSYVLETSPGNGQACWLLSEALSAAEARPLAKSLQRATSSDSGTGDIAHVWRIPGTLNWPNKPKLDRGRPPVPARVTMFQPFSGELVPVARLRGALEPWASDAPTLREFEVGEIPDPVHIAVSATAAALLSADDVGDRSAHASRVVERLSFDGNTVEEALALFMAAGGNWADRYKTAQRRKADFMRAWAKFGAARAEERESAAATAGRLLSDNKTPPIAANDNRPSGYPGIISSGDFVRGFVPPDYHIDGIAQASFLYALTAQTGAGKTAVLLLLTAHTALGLPMGGREIRRGRVIYFAGENPVDVNMRWIGMAHAMGFDPESIDVHFITGAFRIAAMFERIEADVRRLGGAELVIIDTSAAYFQGADENSNTELGRHAREQRALTTLPGKPCVITAAHPVKNAGNDSLLPRGGGAFIAELDGNLVLLKGEGTVKLHWQGKHRGPDFEPIVFELKTVTAPMLRDSRDRDIPTVMATVLSGGEVRQKADEARKDEDAVLLIIEHDASKSLAEMAETLGWYRDSAPHKDRVRRAVDNLRRDKLVTYVRRKWKVTAAGQEASVDARGERYYADAAARSTAGILAKHKKAA